jgi:hypothetical protein
VGHCSKDPVPGVRKDDIFAGYCFLKHLLRVIVSSVEIEFQAAYKPHHRQGLDRPVSKRNTTMTASKGGDGRPFCGVIRRTKPWLPINQ